MNIEMVKNAITQKFGRAGLQVQKYSPEILLGAGILGGVIAAVMAVQAAKKDFILEDHKAEMENVENTEGLTKEEQIRAKAGVFVHTGLEYTKLYGPSIGLGVLSVSAILQSHGIMTKRHVAMTAAYSMLAESYRQYRGRVVEKLGQDVDDTVYEGLVETKVIDEETKKKKTVLVRDPNARSLSMYARCFDNTNLNWSSDRTYNRIFLESQKNLLNDLLILRGHVFLNEVYERLGFKPVPEGQLVGWVLKKPEEMQAEGRDGFISFGLEKPYSQADYEFLRGENDAVWLDFNVDGIVLEEI